MLVLISDMKLFKDLFSKRCLCPSLNNMTDAVICVVCYKTALYDAKTLCN